MAPQAEAGCYICGGVSNPPLLRRFKPNNVLLCDECHKVAKRRFNARRGRKKGRIVQVAARAEWVEALRAA
jgi:hypothetical protein